MTDGQPGLYIHVPFCSGKCPYCDFYSVTAEALIPVYLAGLKREAALYASTWGPFETIYLGGGTPSRLSTAHLAELKTILSCFRLADQVEVTLEANPEDIDPQKNRAILDLGINRISLGVQSFRPEDLLLLDRRHTVDQNHRAIEIIRTAGVSNLSLDLIYGLPGQTIEDWLFVLDQALAYRPEHLSGYQLTIEPGTGFGRSADQGQLALPDEETARDFFLTTVDFLAARGYRQYEVSNFARADRYRSRHNQKYWDHMPYLGLGPAAHSFQSGVRWWNHRSVRRYVDDLTAGRRPIAGEERLTDEQLNIEAIFLGLRTSAGVELTRLGPGGEKVVDQLRAASLAYASSNHLFLTAEGLAIADGIAQELINMLEE